MVTVSTRINSSIEKVWYAFTDPEHIKAWNAASADWHTTRVENDLRPEGVFNYRMEAKDGSDGFDMAGTYDSIVLHKEITYTMDDGRQVRVTFVAESDAVVVTEAFDPESEHSRDLQQQGWQAILDSFKNYVESLP